MTHETSHPNTVIARLEKLERQHRRLKLAGACLLILGSSLLCMGAFSSPSRTVKAEHFALLDPRGKVRARLSTIGDHTMLSFNDRHGFTRASLSVGANGFPGLVFHDQHGQVRVFLGVVDGEPILGLRDRSGTQRAIVRLNQADGAPLIFVTDTGGIWRTLRMTRLPVSSRSAGGRSNAISRVPKPSFARPMKGVTRMPYPHDEPPWTPQDIRALFRLFQTSAPPDFQRQILERVAQRQHAHGRRLGGRALLAWWRGCRAWGGGTLQPHRRWPGPVIAMVGCCGLVLGTSLTWWAVQTGPAVPPTPALVVSQVVLSPPRAPGVPIETPTRGEHHGEFGSTEPQELAVHVAHPLESSARAPQRQTEQCVDRCPASQAGDDPERALLRPAPVQHLTAHKERQPPARRSTQRSGRPRGEPGKPSRPHTRPGTSQQAPG